jgi:hypothetical protein
MTKPYSVSYSLTHAYFSRAKMWVQLSKPSKKLVVNAAGAFKMVTLAADHTGFYIVAAVAA